MNSTVLLIKGSSCRISIAAVRRRGEKMEGKKVSSSLLLICSMFDILEVSSQNRHCRTPKIWFLGRKRHEGSYSMEFFILSKRNTIRCVPLRHSESNVQWNLRLLKQNKTRLRAWYVVACDERKGHFLGTDRPDSNAPSRGVQKLLLSTYKCCCIPLQACEIEWFRKQRHVRTTHGLKKGLGRHGTTLPVSLIYSSIKQE